MARILLVGVDPTLRGRLEAMLPGHRVVSQEGVDPPDLVIADVGRVDAAEVAETFPDVPLLGFSSDGDSNGLRLAQTAGFDEAVGKSVLVERCAELVDALVAPV